ncbi:DUF3043 domain-containing protein [Gordonia sp. (in: high G+C Gram-positive bacteria)]|uniref:DUF3043 domain-containing protein n=1 Tax=Gordonia sp. (in: high G+C Gram-positive bacteria) TaxID=84139 RepID=UPI00169AD0B0|nr:DUF3043 domain-containing protein [Gordonia sp. (in: high G+C Gram-positive bacteria)]NLG46890.1 DUF3043 domain-containing protein [Gordonia sp. (in: high G+C Gram-positive bacteria)]
MKLPWNSDADKNADTAPEETAPVEADDSPRSTGATTPGKGRPTPKRRDAERRRAPMTAPPATRAEARARKKALKSSMTKTERKEISAERRRVRLDQREKMMDGDEKYLMARDRGPVRKMARDIVDSRRNIAGLFLPFAIFLLVMLMLPNLAIIGNLVLLVFVLLVAIDSIYLGRMVNRRVRERFPETTDTGFRLGWYCFTRAMQLRMMRAPRPQAKPGDKV